MTRGEYMRKARMDAGLSIVRLAEISGIAQATISLLERKLLRGGWIDTIEILADALGLSIDEMQLAEDAAFMAANEVLGLGSGRARAFGEAFVRYSNEIADLVVEDSKADDDIVYAKTVLDRRIREIVGEDNFSPFDERYGRR